MNIKIAIINKKLEPFYKEGTMEYEKRLRHYCRIQLHTFKTEDALINEINKKYYTIKVSTGKTKLVSSEAFAQKIDRLRHAHNGAVIFVLGTDRISCDETIHLSPFDIDIGLKTVILYEQIYRAYRIIHQQPYHK